MPRHVKGPDGVIHSFPDQATDQQISVALKAIPSVNVPKASKAPTWSDYLGLNEPTDSPMVGFLRGAGAGVVDLTQGAVSNVTGQMKDKARGDQQAAADMFRITGNVAPSAEKPAIPDVQTPENMSGSIGSALPVLGEMALGGAPVVRAGVNAIPRAARASEKFQDVMAAAKSVPIEVKDVGDAALRVQQLADRGGSMPLSVRKLLNRLTDPEKAPMMYEESRDFASNISRLSADEFGRLTPAIAREVAGLRVALNKANALAARHVGKGEEYASAMKEYARAMRLQSAVNSAVQGAKKSVPIASAAGVGYWLTKQIRDALGQ
jgi:hypothetical protein